VEKNVSMQKRCQKKIFLNGLWQVLVIVFSARSCCCQQKSKSNGCSVSSPYTTVPLQHNVMILCLFGIVKRFRNNNNRFLFFVTNHVAHVICYMYIYMCVPTLNNLLTNALHLWWNQRKSCMIFWRKIVIFHTKYPKNFRASLRNWKKYDFLA
jgi:hypothetical protein